MNILCLEKVIFDFINNLLYSEDEGKEARVYFRFSSIRKYLKNLPRFRIIKIFYDDKKCENPFKIKFPFISYFEDDDKKEEYYHKIKELHRRNKKNKGKKVIKREDCQLYEGKCLYKKFILFIKVLYRRIEIKYYRRNKNKISDMDIYSYVIRYKNRNIIRITDKDTDLESDIEIESDIDEEYSDYSD